MAVPPITNALTIDVEDYFQVSAFAPHIAREQWSRRECRIERNMDRILGLLDERRVKGTFFTLGWIAERYPRLVHDIVRQGHELASHGYDHQRVSDLTPASFYADVRFARLLLEDVGGVAVRGYRAPSFSIGPRNRWAFAVLAHAGYRYSSSVYPIVHDHYGMPGAPRFAFPACEDLLEIPATTLRVLALNLPSGGGGYFRLLPYGLSRWMLRRVNRGEAQPAVFYFHPWEIDAAQPRVAGVGRRARLRHYLNLERTEARLCRLLGDFRWGRMDEIFLSPAEAPAALPAPAAAARGVGLSAAARLTPGLP